jgi:transcriptional regulator with XRE-family HTH domain
MEPDLNTLREQLKAVMAETGLTQIDVATHTKVSQSVLSRFLRGNGLKPDSANKIRAFLGEEVEGVSPLTHEEIRKAVKLYRFIKDALKRDASIVVREKDGSENIVAFLW